MSDAGSLEEALQECIDDYCDQLDDLNDLDTADLADNLGAIVRRIIGAPSGDGLKHCPRCTDAVVNLDAHLSWCRE